MNLVIDIGNTVAKLAVFDNEDIVEIIRGSNHSLDCLPMLCNKYPIERIIIASVITLSNTIKRQLKKIEIPILELTYKTPVPIQNMYKTPETLGMDRLAAVVGANYLSPGKNLLVIDAGTALTYEFIDAQGRYWGGNISPGIYIRFKTLNACCDKLPLIEKGRRLARIRIQYRNGYPRRCHQRHRVRNNGLYPPDAKKISRPFGFFNWWR